jgi:RNA polymerase sigma factor for flagellar operon FliA
MGARDRLVLSLAPMVKAIATRKIRELPAHCELSDLVSSGLIALMAAIDRFDPTRGASLEQYAWTRVSGEIVDELRRQDWAPRSLRRNDRMIEEARRACQTNLGRNPTTEELATAVGISVCDLGRHYERRHQAEVLSLNAQTNDDDAVGVEFVDLLSAHDADADPLSRAIASDRAAALRLAISRLSPRDQRILFWAAADDLPSSEIARRLGISDCRVSQLLKEIRRKLDAKLAAYDAERQAA